MSFLHLFDLLGMASETYLIRRIDQLFFIGRSVRVVAYVAVPFSYRRVDMLIGELGAIVTLEAKIGGATFQSVAVVTLVRVVTSDTVTVGHRTVEMLFEHHVTLGFVTGQTEFFLLQIEFELVVLPSLLDMANGTNLRTHRTMYEFFGPHVGVATGGNAAVIGLSLQRSYRNTEDQGCKE